MARSDCVPSRRRRKECAQVVVQHARAVALRLQLRVRMAHKKVMFRLQAREKILHGAEQIADAIRVTLGPKSKCVLIEKKWGAPLVCNDGVDPTKVVRVALENATSVAGTLLLTEATMTELPEDKPANSAPPLD
jgi:chaperonin GroEL (HSP60 family)